MSICRHNKRLKNSDSLRAFNAFNRAIVPNAYIMLQVVNND